MKEKILNLVKYLFFLVLGVGLLLYVSRDLNVGEVLVEAGKMNFWFFALSGIMALASHYSRAVRWKYLINTLGHHPKTSNVFLSVLVMYLSNLVVPRSGEVARCGSLFKYESIPVSGLLGTVVVERLFDLVVLLLATVALIFLQFDTVASLYFASSIPNLVSNLLENKLFIAVALLALLGGLYFLYRFRNRLIQLKLVDKVIQFLLELKTGFLKVAELKQKWAFVGHTLFIWIMYFGMTYICFFAYEPTANLGVSAGLAVFVAGSYGMVAPTNGGIGAWHFMVITALGIFGIGNTEASSIANVSFVIMTLTVALYGVAAFLLMPYLNGRNKINIEEKK